MLHRTFLIPPIFLLALVIGPARADAAASPIRVAIYSVSKPANSLRRILSETEGFRCRLVSPEAICRGDLRNFDVLIMPGGSARSQAGHLGPQGREAIRKFVADGGGYLGICAGAYFATAYYPWSLHLLNARVVDRAHWARGTGTVLLQLTAAGKRALHEESERVSVYYGQGPLLAPGYYPGLPPYETLARYATAIAKRRGARPESMIGTTAIARATFGSGRVICFSPHPESSSGPNHFIRDGVRWAAGDRPTQGAATGRERPDRSLLVAALEEQITSAGKRLAQALDDMDVEHHWLPGVRVHWRSGEPTTPRRRASTHCSAFVAAACDRLGVYILRPPEHSQTLLANAQQRWLVSEGPGNGWRPIRTWGEAQQLANRGEVVVASWRNPNPRKPGHVALVRPSEKSAETIAAEGPDVIWAGRQNHNRGSLFEGFRRHPKDQVLFFAHPARLR